MAVSEWKWWSKTLEVQMYNKGMMFGGLKPRKWQHTSQRWPTFANIVVDHTACTTANINKILKKYQFCWRLLKTLSYGNKKCFARHIPGIFTHSWPLNDNIYSLSTKRTFNVKFHCYNNVFILTSILHRC